MRAQVVNNAGRIERSYVGGALLCGQGLLTIQPKRARRHDDLQQAAIKNMFAVLIGACKYCPLGQLTEAMFEVGGQYRRNM